MFLDASTQDKLLGSNQWCHVNITKYHDISVRLQEIHEKLNIFGNYDGDVNIKYHKKSRLKFCNLLTEQHTKSS